MAVTAATGVDIQMATGELQVIQQMINNMAAYRAKEQEREKDDSTKDDIIERREEIREVSEKEKSAAEREEEKEAVLERIEEKERIMESAEISERQEQFVGLLEERMKESETDIKEALEDVISVFEETGLAQTVESVHQMVEEGELGLAKAEVEEIVDNVRERAALVKKLAGEIEGMSGDKNVGADKLAKEIEVLAEKDKSDFGRELEVLAKDLKGMEKQEAIDHVKDFIDEHSRQLGALKDVERLLDNWDKLSQKQIAGALRDISNELTKEMTSLEKSAGELQKLIAVPDDFIKKAKKLFAEDSEMLGAIRRKWIGAVIDFTKEKLFRAETEKDAKEKAFWTGALVKTNKMRDKALDDFNRSLAELMRGRPKDLQEARARANESVVDHVRKAADAIAGGRYSERLEKISRMADKESMKSPLARLASDLHEIGKRAEALLQKVEKGDLKGILDELGRPDGSTGIVGRVMIKTVDRNRCKAKKEMIKELLGSINMINGVSRMAEGLQNAMERKDYDLVDEMCQELKNGIRSMKQADREISAILNTKRMPRKARRSRIAKVFAKLIFIGKLRPANN